MADTERKIIPVTARQALQYVGAIEGLIFDPQPYRGPETTPTTNSHRGFLRFPWVRSQKETPAPTLDHIKDNLRRRYGNDLSKRFYELTQGSSEKDPEGDDREFVCGSHLYKINERPSLLIEAGGTRKYQMDLQLVRDSRWNIVFSFLHLKQAALLQAEANLMLCSPNIMRVKSDGKYGESYIPSFIEQQRLFEVNELFRKYIKPTWPPTPEQRSTQA